HTRFSRDWSSDVCSSDLYQLDHAGTELIVGRQLEMRGVVPEVAAHLAVVGVGRDRLVHGEFGKFGHAFGRDQVRTFIHGAVRVRSEERRVGKEGTEWGVA